MNKSQIATLAVVGFAATAAVIGLNSFQAEGSSFLSTVNQDDADFVKFVSQYRKSYLTKEEYNFRMKQFQATKAKIAEVNGQNGNTFTVGINQFSDYTPAEYKKMLGYKKSTMNHEGDVKTLKNVSIPQSWDWRQHNAVTGVKNQGQCGSCWSFSTTGSMEGAHAIKTGQLVSLSEQQLVDCSTQNHGCNGGSMQLAIIYTATQHLETEGEYPYEAKNDGCRFNPSEGVVGATGYANIQSGNNGQLKLAVAQQPVSIAIEADQSVFQSYTGGILNSAACGTNLDHGVLIVGYGQQNNQDYWIVKNSWGAGWGEQGYIRIADVAGNGICGINMAAIFPVTN